MPLPPPPHPPTGFHQTSDSHTAAAPSAQTLPLPLPPTRCYRSCCPAAGAAHAVQLLVRPMLFSRYRPPTRRGVVQGRQDEIKI